MPGSSTRTTWYGHRRLFGESFPTTLRCANNLAVDLRLLGDFRSARTLDEQTLRHRQSVLAGGHPETLSSRASLAYDLFGLGDFAGACGMLGGVVAGHRDALGDDHPMMLWAGRFEAMAARRTGSSDARARAAANVALFRQKFGDLNVETLGAVVSLANCCRDAGDPDEAHRLLERAVVRYHAVLGEEHPFTYAAASNLATVVRVTGRATEARTIDAEAFGGLRRTVGADHPFTLSCANGFAADLALTGDHEQARAIAVDTLTRSRAVRGPDHPDTLACAFNVALDAGDADGCREAVAALHTSYGGAHPIPAAAAAGVRLDSDIEPPPL